MACGNSAARYRWEGLANDSPMALLERRRIIGKRVMLSHVTLKKGCVVPSHAHPNEQFACVLSGRLRFEIGCGEGSPREELVLVGGEVLHFPPNVPHGAEALEDTIVLDVFSPPSETTGIDRED